MDTLDLGASHSSDHPIESRRAGTDSPNQIHSNLTIPIAARQPPGNEESNRLAPFSVELL
jgi:hypothetical protein